MAVVVVLIQRDSASIGVGMSDYVEVALRRNRGWPWPDDSWGLTPMFGKDGWCSSCGTPSQPQTGPLVLRRQGLRVEGAWVPNWRFDVFCLAGSLVSEAESRFELRFCEIVAPGGHEIDARQIVIAPSLVAWFDPTDLVRLIMPIHGEALATCAACAVIRWMPVEMDVLPKPSPAAFVGEPPVLASPEWFGDGMQSFSQIVWRRDVADFLVAASPKDFKIRELCSGSVG